MAERAPRRYELWRCKSCGTHWRRWQDDGSWNVCGQPCGYCDSSGPLMVDVCDPVLEWDEAAGIASVPANATLAAAVRDAVEAAARLAESDDPDDVYCHDPEHARRVRRAAAARIRKGR